MSTVWADRLEIERGGRPLTGLSVVALSALLLSAHYTGPIAGTATPGRMAPPAAAPARPLHAGHPEAATRAGWRAERSFRRVTLAAWGRFAALDSAEQLVVLKLNRVDLAHAGKRSLLVPDVIGDELSYSPLPATLPELAGVPQMVLVSRRVQAFGAYEHGRLVRWGPTSTGKAATPTDAGLFFTNWKSRKTISTDDPNWILEWYVNFVSDKGVAFHQYDLPGYPGSHGCVRLLAVDARWVYRWTAEWQLDRAHRVVGWGTPVLVFGDYDATRAAPWRRLAEEPGADQVSPAEVRAALDPVLPTVLTRAGRPRQELARR